MINEVENQHADINQLTSKTDASQTIVGNGTVDKPVSPRGKSPH